MNKRKMKPQIVKAINIIGIIALTIAIISKVQGNDIGFAIGAIIVVAVAMNQINEDSKINKAITN